MEATDIGLYSLEALAVGEVTLEVEFDDLNTSVPVVVTD